MKFLELIFALLAKFIDFPPGRLTTLKKQAAEWEDEQQSEGKNTVFTKVLKYQDIWYVQVILAILFLVGVKQISNWLMAEKEPQLLDEEELDEEEPRAQTKFKLG